MTKPKLKHISAITRCQHLLETGINIDGNEKLRKSIEGDIALLCEVRTILFEFIENPGLPFVLTQPDSAQPILDQIANEPNGKF